MGELFLEISRTSIGQKKLVETGSDFYKFFVFTSDFFKKVELFSSRNTQVVIVLVFEGGRG